MAFLFPPSAVGAGNSSHTFNLSGNLIITGGQQGGVDFPVQEILGGAANFNLTGGATITLNPTGAPAGVTLGVNSTNNSVFTARDAGALS